MNYKFKSPGDKVFDFFNISFMVVFGITILFPFISELAKSFSGETYILTKGFPLLPGLFTVNNWKIIIFSKRLWQSFGNSVYVTVLSSIYSLFLSVTYAYPLSRRDLPHRNLFTFIMLFTMFFSGGLIPSYLLSYNLGLVNKLAVLIIGGLSAWNTIIIRNFFMALPLSLQESAIIDGASEPVILLKIMLPLSMPVLATVTLWNLVGSWNSWVGCMIYISDPNKQVLPIILRELLFQNLSFSNTDDIYKMMESSGGTLKTMEGFKSATLIFTILPILLSYPFLQKYFVKGILIGSLKG